MSKLRGRSGQRLAITGLTAALALMLATRAAANHVTAASGNGQQFVWPVPAWVAADEFYVDGSHHSGSADLSVPHYTPVRASRTGTVIEKRWSQFGGWSVKIEHPGTTYTYTTYYAHLVAEPLVDVGDSVLAVTGGGTILGYSSRTGHAKRGGPHVHFQINRINNSTGENVTMAIPGLAVGDWVHFEDFVPGNFTGLSALSQPTRTFTVKTSEAGVKVYSTSDRTTVVATLSAGASITVANSYRGQYYGSYVSNQFGWVAHTGTVPTNSGVFGVQTDLTINVRRTPGGVDVGDIPVNELLTAVDTNAAGDWYKVQWQCGPDNNQSSSSGDAAADTGGCPGLSSGFSNKYGWVAASVVSSTPKFEAITRIDLLNVYANEIVGGGDDPDTDIQIAELPIATTITVLETKNGWYKFTYNGETAWIRGWYTAGRQ